MASLAPRTAATAVLKVGAHLGEPDAAADAEDRGELLHQEPAEEAVEYYNPYLSLCITMGRYGL
jgi:hypothetical protein